MAHAPSKPPGGRPAGAALGEMARLLASAPAGPACAAVVLFAQGADLDSFLRGLGGGQDREGGGCPAGVVVLREGGLDDLLALLERADTPAAPFPRFDPGERALHWRGQVVKRLRREALVQEAVLAAF